MSTMYFATNMCNNWILQAFLQLEHYSAKSKPRGI